MPKDWDSVKAHIKRLYLRENRSLSEVVLLMKTEYGFDASVRAYRMRLSDWGYHKSTSRDNSAIQKKTLSPETPSTIAQRMEQLGPYISTFPSTPGLEINDISPPHIPNTIDVPSGSNAPFHPRFNLVEPVETVNSHFYDKQPLQTLLLAISNHSLKDIADCLLWNTGLANQQDAGGRTPLHYAATQGAGALIQHLIIGGGDINAVDKHQRTPLHLAVRFPKTIKAILLWHPNISPQDNKGSTPLHLAINLCDLDEPLEGSSIDLLVHAGADVNTLNYEKESPLYLLIQKLATNGKHRIAYMILFLKNNADLNGTTPEGEPLRAFLATMPEFHWSSPNTKLSSEAKLLDCKLYVSGDLPIYQAARLGDRGDLLVRCILDQGSSAIMEHKMLQFPSNGSNQTNHYCLWKDYYNMIEKENYHELEALSRTLDQYAPADVLKSLKPLACSYAAEKLLTGAEKDFKSGKESGHKIVSIIRICRKLDLELNPRWYDLLLELFDQVQ